MKPFRDDIKKAFGLTDDSEAPGDDAEDIELEVPGGGAEDVEVDGDEPEEGCEDDEDLDSEEEDVDEDYEDMGDLVDGLGYGVL